ncbi:MtrB/PioB family decaheme-associated outer membrane protein [Pseudomarimonas arenosa]|uniref:MtrB/PioB family decaheme-associated outer membrane protein n=1 Tax=Pseudomarimonas arenosa TaxID=2774145 RepID=A0AAW3ZKS1_9GAMM|nr:MtrB/PioB family decaheme-associated outer membrane protein [Pseudomarimonas arenosa]MBD8526114.1 MtrB/PioB family decaheme-associated outer membrane protein [Pseudomarimonas arenosa]
MRWLCSSKRPCCLLAVAMLASGAAYSQSNDMFRLELGLGYVDADSLRFGRYNDLSEQGGYGVLNLDWWRAASHPDQADLRLHARQLGLEARSVELDAQRPGRYRVWLSYVELPVYLSEHGFTPFRGVGSSDLGLPGNWQPGASSAGFSQLPGSLARFSPKTERRVGLLGLQGWLSIRWDTTVELREQRKQGLTVLAGTIGNSGGTPRVAFLPTPVDERSREVEWALRYADTQRQFSLGYLLSLFDNQVEAIRWQNPYSAISGWHPSAGYPTGQGQIARDPDNQFHQLSMAFAQSWRNGLRLAADLSLGRGTQDEAFLPYTINPQQAASVVEALPRSSLDGRVDTRRLQLRLSQRLDNGLDWALRWRDDERDNQSPHAQFVYIGGDSMLQDAAASSGRRRFNEPYSYAQQLIEFDAGYRSAAAGSWRFGWQRSEIEREQAERLQAREDRLQLQYRQRLGQRGSFALKTEHSDRDGSTYIGNRPFLAAYTPEFIDTLVGDFENHPQLRRFHQADRRRWRFSANLSWQWSERWTLSLQADRSRDDYYASPLGLTDADSRLINTQLQFAPNQDWQLALYQVDERRQFEQAGHAFRGGATRIDQINDPANRWSVVMDDHWQTSGLQLNWRPPDRAFSASFDLLYGDGRSALLFEAGSAVAAAPLPDYRDDLLGARSELRWRLNPRAEVKLAWWHERYRVSNPTDGGLPPDQLANVLLPGFAEPDYQVNVITLSWVQQF